MQPSEDFKGKWLPKCRRFGEDEQVTFLDPLDPWTLFHENPTYRNM
jgi:hypothetical protein